MTRVLGLGPFGTRRSAVRIRPLERHLHAIAANNGPSSTSPDEVNTPSVFFLAETQRLTATRSLQSNGFHPPQIDPGNTATVSISRRIDPFPSPASRPTRRASCCRWPGASWSQRGEPVGGGLGRFRGRGGTGSGTARACSKRRVRAVRHTPGGGALNAIGPFGMLNVINDRRRG